MPAELQTIIDLIRYGASRFGEAGLTFGHSYDNVMDESTQLVLHALHLPHDLNPIYGASRVTAEEKAKVLALFQRRIEERIPACYLTGEAWFAGLSFKSDASSPGSATWRCATRSISAPAVAASPSPWGTTTPRGTWMPSTSAPRRFRWRGRTSNASMPAT